MVNMRDAQLKARNEVLGKDEKTMIPKIVELIKELEEPTKKT